EEIGKETKKINLDYYKGKLDSFSFWNKIIRHFNLKIDSKINPAALSKAYLKSYRLYPEIIDAIKKIKKNHQTALLSNLTPEMRNFIKSKHSPEQYFDFQIYSCDSSVSSVKPFKKIFKILIKKINCHPSECLFIDDSLDNISSASRLGFKVILFKNTKEFLKDISGFLK
ncbi:MAG: HAD-IA family hydrolase, partial [Candidatus Pacebacteria bacterium]|nr:HAD-IA family hydrolase [Candidatus Paceibacterota bacterium]